MRLIRAIAVVAGIAIAWVGLALVWERWSGLARSYTTTGFHLDDARLFRYLLVIVTLIAAAHVVRPGWKALRIGLAVAALALAGCAVRAALAILQGDSTFVHDAVGIGVWVSVAGALVLVAAARPHVYALAGGAVVLLVIALVPSGGLGKGELDTPVTSTVGETFALDGDNVISTGVGLGEYVYSYDRAGEEPRTLFSLAAIKSGFSEDVRAVARAGDVLYLELTNTGVMRVPAHGKPRMIAVGPPHDPAREHPIGDIEVPDFHPSRLATGPDGALYILDQERVYRWQAGKLAPVAGTGSRGFSGDGGPAAQATFDAPQDIAVDGHNRLYVADTGNGRVRRVNADGTVETILGKGAAPGCEHDGQDEPESLDPAKCHVIEALAADKAGNVFAATGGVPRVLALTTTGHYGVVAGTGIAGTNRGDGRAVSARIGAVNKLEVAPDGDLYVGEFDRTVRMADPLSGLGQKPGPAPAGPRAACDALARFDAQAFREDVGYGNYPPSPTRLIAALRAADDSAPWIKQIKDRLGSFTTDRIRAASVKDGMGGLLRQFGDDACGLFDGRYRVSPEQGIRFCTAYIREWDKINEAFRNDKRWRIAVDKTYPLLPRALQEPAQYRGSEWENPVNEFAQDACAASYRWSTTAINS